MVQTAALGIALVPVYSLRAWWLFILFSKVMVTLSAIEAASRPAYAYRHMLQHSLIAVGSSATLTVTFYAFMVSPGDGKLALMHLVPVLGVLLAHIVNGVGSGIASMCHECVIGRDQVEVMLSLGASRSEALSNMIRQALTSSVSPIFSQVGQHIP